MVPALRCFALCSKLVVNQCTRMYIDCRHDCTEHIIIGHGWRWLKPCRVFCAAKTLEIKNVHGRTFFIGRQSFFSSAPPHLLYYITDRQVLKGKDIRLTDIPTLGGQSVPHYRIGHPVIMWAVTLTLLRWLPHTCSSWYP